MARLKRIAIAVLAAATVAAGSLAVAPTASAYPRLSCEQAIENAVYHWHLGWQYYALGDWSNAYHHWDWYDVWRRASCY